MDGVEDQDLSAQFAGQTSQLAVLPDESVVFPAYGSNGCSDIKRRTPDGQVRTIVNSGAAQGDAGPCSVRGIEYSPGDDTLVFSDYDNRSLVKVGLDGEVRWVLHPTAGDFTLTPSSLSWATVWGLSITGSQLLFFDNGTTGTSSRAIELLLDPIAMTATLAWEYTPTPSISNTVFGDAQRLWNGNVLVTYSTRGVLHEVAPNLDLVQEISWPIGYGLGLVQKRPSLYGPPPE
jgi:hypothetical protein